MDELKFLASYYVSVLLIIAVGDRARRSPRKLPTSMKEERKKWVMPKFLPHKYDVKLVNEDKVRHWFLVVRGSSIKENAFFTIIT